MEGTLRPSFVAPAGDDPYVHDWHDLPTDAGVAPGTSGRRELMLGLATLGFAVNFWAWVLLSPLGPRFKDSLHLSAFRQSRRCRGARR